MAFTRSGVQAPSAPPKFISFNYNIYAINNNIMNFRVIFSLIASVSGILLLFFFWFKNVSEYQKTDNAFIRGSITSIASRVDGYVLTVPGVLNSKVEKGESLVIFDPEPFKAKYSVSIAELDSSRAMITEIEAMLNAEKLKIEEKVLSVELASTKINMSEAKKLSEISNLEYFRKNKARMEQLYENKNITKSKLDKALANFESATHKVEQFASDLKAKNIEKKVIKKEIKKLELNLKKLEAEKERYIAKKKALSGKVKASLIDLESTKIVSPTNGIIANRIVEPGVYMKKGWPLMSIVPIEDVWVIANFKETQLKSIKINQEAIIKVDAYPNSKISGKVLSISPASASSFSIIPPQNSSGNFVKVVQRIPVKIALDIPDELIGKILPGMSVIAKIITK